MKPCNKYNTSLYNLLADDHKRTKNPWYTGEKVENIEKRSKKTRKNLTSNITRIPNHKASENVTTRSMLPEESICLAVDRRRQYRTSKSKPVNIKPLSSGSSLISSSSKSTILHAEVNNSTVNMSLSSNDMKRLAVQINNVGQTLVKLAASMEAGKIQEENLYLTKKLKSKKLHQTNCRKNKIYNDNNDKTVMEDLNVRADDIDDDNYCSAIKAGSMKLRGNKKKRKINDELKYTMRKNDSFNSIHSIDMAALSGHPQRFRNDTLSSLDRQIHRKGVDPENCDTENVRVAANDAVSSTFNRKKFNKNKKIGKMAWKFNHTDFLDEELF